ncbi:MAG: hypothetical protein H6830_12115 [Planctomycetes bacterium]|nr:hypothetical protein [Planctomycetota bacterium]MCB9910825.1 hypothetical protein [Planctomycetota bacterium]MCB9912243.1 hypothetical protein [Planctomycetota bacterium]HPF13838.1 hypothetical protein [Planctomycetota bacterium]HRV83121.1 hypothetical protein [Planctomycetota bacterium]
MITTAFSIAGLALAANLAVWNPVPQANELKVGDPAPTLQIAEWVKGAPIPSLAKDHVYVIEFWATW